MRRDQTRRDETRPDQTRPDQTIRDQTRPDHTRPDQTPCNWCSGVTFGLIMSQTNKAPPDIHSPFVGAVQTGSVQPGNLRRRRLLRSVSHNTGTFVIEEYIRPRKADRPPQRRQLAGQITCWEERLFFFLPSLTLTDNKPETRWTQNPHNPLLARSEKVERIMKNRTFHFSIGRTQVSQRLLT